MKKLLIVVEVLISVLLCWYWNSKREIVIRSPPVIVIGNPDANFKE